MIQTLEELLNAHREPIYLLFRRLKAMDRQFLLWSDLVHDYEQFCQSEVGAPLLESGMTPIMRHAQEAVVDEPFINLAVRMRVGRWKYVQVHTEEMRCRELTVAEFLDIKERVAAGIPPGDRYVLEVDLSPFERGFPKLKDSRNIGRGVEFLNRHLSGRLFMDGGRGEKLLFDFLQVHEVRGQQLMLNGTLRDVEELREALAQATTLLEAHTEESDALNRELRRLGFESGWGRTPERIRESMELLLDILEAPSPGNLERFLARMPMIFSIAILSPHGYFGQSNVLGKPDTGGQIVYILDQVRALEREMRESIHEQGLDIEPQIVVVTRLIPEADGTTCDQPRDGKRAHPSRAVSPPQERGGHPSVDLALRGLAVPRALCHRRAARASCGARWRAARFRHRQLLGWQPRRDHHGASARGHAVQHRSRAREDEVSVVRPALAGPRGAIHRGLDGDEHCGLHHHQHLSRDRRHGR
jgi:sucrose synthase